jgi:hypothetical protein
MRELICTKCERRPTANDPARYGTIQELPRWYKGCDGVLVETKQIFAPLDPYPVGHQKSYWDSVTELAAMREHIPEERRKFSGVREMFESKPEEPTKKRVVIIHEWELTDEDALEFVRHVESALSLKGWHCALGGSVLQSGRSSKDLDLIVYPRKRRSDRPSKWKLRRLYQAFKLAGMKQRRTREWLQKDWRSRGIQDEKWVEVWQDEHGRRVDVMVLS